MQGMVNAIAPRTRLLLFMGSLLLGTLSFCGFAAADSRACRVQFPSMHRFTVHRVSCEWFSQAAALEVRLVHWACQQRHRPETREVRATAGDWCRAPAPLHRN